MEGAAAFCLARLAGRCLVYLFGLHGHSLLGGGGGTLLCGGHGTLLCHHGSLRLGLLKAVAHHAGYGEHHSRRGYGCDAASLAASHEAQVLGSLLLLPPIAAILLQELFYIVYLIHLTFAFVIVNKLGT